MHDKKLEKKKSLKEILNRINRWHPNAPTAVNISVNTFDPDTWNTVFYVRRYSKRRHLPDQSSLIGQSRTRDVDRTRFSKIVKLFVPMDSLVCNKFWENQQRRMNDLVVDDRMFEFRMQCWKSFLVRFELCFWKENVFTCKWFVLCSVLHVLVNFLVEQSKTFLRVVDFRSFHHRRCHKLGIRCRDSVNGFWVG